MPYFALVSKLQRPHLYPIYPHHQLQRTPFSSNVTVQKNNQPDYEAERRKLQQRTQNALSQNSKRNGNHSETNNRNSQNTRQENTQVPKALRNNIDKDNWKKIIEEEKKDF